jgi:hypothetical protein
MIPAYIRYTDDMPTWMGGYAKWFYIAIRPKYKDDAGIHAHELEHVKQWWITTIIATALIAAIVWYTKSPQHYYIYSSLGLVMFQLLYMVIPQFKLRMEVLAYKKQLPHYPDDRTKLFAGFIAKKYGLKITAEEAAELLKG